MKETKRYETQRDRLIAELAKPPFTDQQRREVLEPLKPRGMQTSEARKRGVTFRAVLTPGKAVRL